MKFEGIQLISVLDLEISQLYLSETKLTQVQSWLSPGSIALCQPLPVHDFGNGRYTLTDGHSRAFVAYCMGISELPIIYDEDEIVSGEPGFTLYQEDIRWCERFHLHNISDLSQRILSDQEYQKKWMDRCERSYYLLTQTTEQERIHFSEQGNGLFLYGASSDLTIFYFEDCQGNLWKYTEGIFKKETE